jgi:hypothetical protein
LKHVFAFLLKDERLDFLPHFFKRPELFRFLIVQPHDVQALRAFNNVRNAARNEIRDASLDRGQQFALTDQSQSPPS